MNNINTCTFCDLSNITALKDELAACVRGLFCQGLVSSGGGNHSIRIPMSNNILITPSGYPRSHLKGEDIVTIDINGDVVEGMLRPTIEVPFHTEIYQKKSYAGAVCHTHSPYTQAFALSTKLYPTNTAGIYSIDETNQPFPKVLKRRLAILEYQQLGSRALAKLVGQACGVFDNSIIKEDRFNGVMILLNHGVIGIGRCIHEAKFMVEVLEEWAKCQIVGKIFI